ncbi:MAG: UDP-N-acetylmuramate--L-alanine ligase [Rhodospirillales bacterium]|nr:UDP-N-acetylmuramate--L-alanine ligase [Alphaproteobacteria bacterium]MCB9986988.1 UDP-N-acetylmuramate--L-alanine ligase [Rhodospirillales bacterium]USO08238.1 MAG: UDP-N-acetylmuramate--L-alanine ligase [Rhodospirillales bacterium]
MSFMPRNIGMLHFVGIGGIGMSGIAEMLMGLGYQVQGSDAVEGANTRRLAEKGIGVMIGHHAANLMTATGAMPAAVVVSSAIKPDNPELEEAVRRNIPVVHRAEMLAELMRLKWSIGIAGTHGKTTTTSMVGAMLEAGGMDPTVINGGIVNSYGTNTRQGGSQWMVVETDESDGSFISLPLNAGVITNIDPEHLDHYGSFAALKAAFAMFVQNLPFYGFAVLCADHRDVRELIPQLSNRRLITYGFAPDAQVRASDVQLRADGAVFDITVAGCVVKGDDRVFKGVRINVPGRHNVQNSLAAVAVGLALGMDEAGIRKGLEGFAGVKRRFTNAGQAGGVTVIDDYAHHPVEIRTVLATARTVQAESGGRVIAVMQPHRYTRLANLIDDFAACFVDADSVFIADVYAAGEKPIEGADRDHLVAAARARGHEDVSALESPDMLAAILADKVRPGDMVVCLGAGSITNWAHALPGQLEPLLAKDKAA